MGLYLESFLVIYHKSGNDRYWDLILGFIRKLRMWYVYRKSIKESIQVIVFNAKILFMGET